VQESDTESVREEHGAEPARYETGTGYPHLRQHEPAFIHNTPTSIGNCLNWHFPESYRGITVKTIIHVNQHVIKSNRVHKLNNPALTVKTYKENRKGHEAIVSFRNPDSNEVFEVGRFVYRPDKPLACGAHVWFETTEEVYVS
jgi:hypothetical protein